MSAADPSRAYIGGPDVVLVPETWGISTVSTSATDAPSTEALAWRGTDHLPRGGVHVIILGIKTSELAWIASFLEMLGYLISLLLVALRPRSNLVASLFLGVLPHWHAADVAP